MTTPLSVFGLPRIVSIAARRLGLRLGAPCRRLAAGGDAGSLKYALALMAIAILPLSTAEASRQSSERGKPTVAVSVAPQAWLVERLGGDEVDTLIVVDQSSSHETHQPTDRQATDLNRAAIYFRVGLNIEHGPWFNALERSGKVRIVNVSDAIPRRELEGHEHHHHHHHHDHHHACSHDGSDPHIWTAPEPLRLQARVMAKAMEEAGLVSSELLRDRLAALELELDELDADLARILEPCRGRSFFVFHPSWGFLADAYGMRQVPVERNGKPPTDRELTEIQRHARSEGINTIFIQPQIPSRAAEAVAVAIDGRVESLDPMRPDVPANLRHVAKRLAASCR